MSDDDLDLATIERYRRVLEEAAAQLDARDSRRVAGATAAVFAALDRRDAENREMRAIVRDLAGLTFTAADMFDSPVLVALAERARRLVG
jgi:hypothetical protein